MGGMPGPAAGQDVLNPNLNACPSPAALPHRPAPGHAPYLLLQTWWLQRLLSDQDPKVTYSCHQVLGGQQGLQGHSPGAQGPPNGRVTAEFTWLLLLFLLFLLVPGHRNLQGTRMGTSLSRGLGSLKPNPAPCPPLHPDRDVCKTAAAFSPQQGGTFMRGLGWRRDSLTHQTGAGEGPSFPHHYFCNSDIIWTSCFPSTLP